VVTKRTKEEAMATCEVCENEYDRTMEITLDGERHVFDSFECAIHALAPTCEHCGCRVIGHGIQSGDRIFCCVSCAAQSGVVGVADRA
jgi:Rieske Fe-S protein